MIDTATMKRALDLADKARECLGLSRAFARQRIIITPDGMWGADKFLNGAVQPQVIGFYGTVCAISTLISCGEAPASECIRNCVRLVLSDTFRVEGGWATSTIKGESKIAMVNATCYALNALLDADIDPRRQDIREGLDWLRRARNRPGRWGHFRGDRALRMTATCNALVTIARAARHGSELAQADYASAVRWLKSTQDAETGGWPRGKPEVGYTALAVLALASVAPDEDAVRKGAAFIATHADKWRTVTERFRVPRTEGAPLDEEYHVYTEAVAVSALLRAGTHPCSEHLLQGVEALISTQEPGSGFWRDPEGNILCWQLMYGCRAFADFIASTEAKVVPADHASGLHVISVRLQEISGALQRLEARVSRLEERDLRQACQRLARRSAERGRRLWGWLRHHWLLACLVAAIGDCLYGVVYVRVIAPWAAPQSNPVKVLLSGGSFIGLFFGLLSLVRSLQRRQ